MISADGPGWAVTNYEGKPLPGRWATREDAQTEGNLGVYLFSGIDVIEMPDRQFRKAKLDNGWWQIYGVGDLRWTIFGTVEKSGGCWFAVTAEQKTERSCDQLKEGAQWVANKHSGAQD